ncbi:efflux RND transporter periplasmic adaptor subunit [Salinimicrobium sediminilitoris]|uniref:efflux RND transporter periplasmic adaptor subunit n=1 Tax=Salinimicrobium sediminilitoris TaxID=2876715 RepID=UPI001E34E485|nr:efflux RND transporter periplasmic adaptor subunit [Salinimicrobium sediminilitoris]MCC8360925.1 efflux RND transporter periplasmic adaptor subunit [Salinimicrobium sediminilitoris]
MTGRNKNILIIAGTLVAGILLGWLFFGGSDDAEIHDHSSEVAQETVWTCSMHPQIRATEPGKCPICGMDLIPLESSDAMENPDAVQMTEYAMKLANIQTQEVGSTSAEREIELNGKVVVDERISYTQSTHVPGRIERLMVNFTGEEVRRGQALAVVYSPELVTAQEELLQAYAIRESQPELFEAAKQKLRNWRIGENQINRILESGKATDRFTITADVNGVVTEKLVEVGDYVERGMPLYQIADLSKMWVLFDLYERTLGMVNVGDTVEFTVASIPGETFTGTINFIDPIIDRQTRVATARVEVSNIDQRLKPEMFVSGVVTGGGDDEAASGLTIPRSAVLWTGKRSIVYVNEGTANNPLFVMREVVLGQLLGSAYVVQEGLAAGEEIVVNGTFTVDAAAQLAGKPSMMNPATATSAAAQVDVRQYLQDSGYDYRAQASGEFQQQLDLLVRDYLQLKDALVEGQAEESLKFTKQFANSLQQITATGMAGEAEAFWQEKKKFLLQHSEEGLNTTDLKKQRENFVYLSEALIKTVAAFGTGDKTIYVDYCPMANSDKGAYWLSDVAEIRNPYYGDAMLTCGEIVEQIQ